jgi:TetR/AcrR family acrAB operon transcriptional repressor
MARKTPEETARTREAILDAALRVFAERGFSAAQLEDIAARASVTRGAVYHHFTGKEDLLGAVLSTRWTTAMAPVLAPLERAGDADAVHAFVTGFLRAVDSDAAVRALMKISLSGDLPAPASTSGLAEKRGVWEHWIALIARCLAPARGGRVTSRDRAEIVVVYLIGHAVWSTLVGPSAAHDWSGRASALLGGLVPPASQPRSRPHRGAVSPRSPRVRKPHPRKPAPRSR